MIGMKHDTSFGDRQLILFFRCVTGVFALMCVLPLWVALTGSFSNENALVREGYSLWVREFDVSAYKLLFSGNSAVWKAYGVTIVSTFFGVILTVILTSAFAYPLTVKTVKYRNRISLFAYATMLFNGGLVPTYILISRFLHLRNSILVLIIPGALNAYNMFLMKNYFATIPESLAESAKIDGATDIYIFFRIILPLSKPILATVALFAAMGYWNEWFKVLLFIDDTNLYTLQFLLMRLQQQVDFLNSSLGAAARSALGSVTIPTIGIRLATAMISIGPIVLLYPFLQRYFVKGLTIGAIKG